MTRRTLLLLLGLAAAVVLFLAFRPGGDDETVAATTEAPPPPPPAGTGAATTGEAAPPPPPPPPAPPAVPTARIEIRDGEIVGGLRRITIARGETLRLIVTSDVADHVHVHGIDAFQDVGPGEPARFTLTPEVAGRYEIELEDRHFQIAQLNVEP